ncbi:hypothetical protein ART_1935 [Arthrobacter sp. PAMC 25486]|nr:hypothetical protein ART_1935 [Arthrobacter sp. PAMC 25486]
MDEDPSVGDVIAENGPIRMIHAEHRFGPDIRWSQLSRIRRPG